MAPFRRASCERPGRLARRHARRGSRASRAGMGEDPCSLLVRAGLDAALRRRHRLARIVRGRNLQARRDRCSFRAAAASRRSRCSSRVRQARVLSPRRARRRNAHASSRWARPPSSTTRRTPNGETRRERPPATVAPMSSSRWAEQARSIKASRRCAMAGG